MILRGVWTKKDEKAVHKHFSLEPEELWGTEFLLAYHDPGSPGDHTLILLRIDGTLFEVVTKKWKPVPVAVKALRKRLQKGLWAWDDDLRASMIELIEELENGNDN